MTVDWNGKRWLRLGECNRCGECCFAGWKQSCPQIRQQPDYTVLCAIREELEVGGGDDPGVLAVCGVMTSACLPWPANPGDLLNAGAVIRNRCGYGFIEAPRILLACPTHECKGYAMRRWVDAIKAITYPADILVVDNSPTLDFMRLWENEVPMVHIDVEVDHPMVRMNRSMEVIRQHFLAGPYDWWLNIEADVIVPPDVVETLLKLGGDADWISHAYPSRHPGHGDDPAMEKQSGIGCSLLSRRMIEEIGWQEAGTDGPDCWLWDLCRRAMKFRAVDCWGHMKLDHLAA